MSTKSGTHRRTVKLDRTSAIERMFEKWGFVLPFAYTPGTLAAYLAAIGQPGYAVQYQRMFERVCDIVNYLEHGDIPSEQDIKYVLRIIGNFYKMFRQLGTKPTCPITNAIWAVFNAMKEMVLYGAVKHYSPIVRGIIDKRGVPFKVFRAVGFSNWHEKPCLSCLEVGNGLDSRCGCPCLACRAPKCECPRIPRWKVDEHSYPYGRGLPNMIA